MWEPVTLTMSNNAPASMSWSERCYEVLDTPTPLDMDYGVMTHPLPNPGWRFIGRADDGDTRVFDVRFDRTAVQWRLVGSYA